MAAVDSIVTAEEAEADLVRVPQGFFDKHPSKPHLGSFEDYQRLYNFSITSPDAFWADRARELLTWDQDFQTTHVGGFHREREPDTDSSSKQGDAGKWFVEGQLNACFNCVDRHAKATPDKAAIIYESDEPVDSSATSSGESVVAGKSRSLSYAQLLRDVCQLAGALRYMGVQRGDTVAIYLPMVPEALVAMLACSRIGAVHSVVFAGFSADSLRDRIVDADSRVIITADEGRRGGRTINTKKIVDEALAQCPRVKHCLVYKRTGGPVAWTQGRDYWWHQELPKYPSYTPPESMNSEDPLFLLYTSGSTGKPKGIVHTTAGYLLGAAITGKYVFDIHPDDVFFCGGDVGWITGHTYVVYAPLVLGATTIVFEGTPTYPNMSRYWDIIDAYNVAQFYVAPTALRLLKRGTKDSDLARHKFERLRVLGSVGEPIAAEVWKWYYEVVGRSQAHIIDTYWQTETGCHVITPLAGITSTKPGSAALPFFGIEPAVVHPTEQTELKGKSEEGVLCFKQPWPSMARTVWKDHERYMKTYLLEYPGYYFTGDGVGRDSDGHYWIRGRVDDVINVSGHRLSTAEIEAALLEHPAVGEAAAVGVHDEISGQAVNAFVSLKPGYEHTEQIKRDLVLQIRRSIGPFAAPKAIFTVDDLPKTRSGKIMRRILRKTLAGEEDQLGDTSTLQNEDTVQQIIEAVKSLRAKQ